MGTTRRRFGREYEQEVVEMVVEGGQAVSDLAKDLEIRPEMIRRWVKQPGFRSRLCQLSSGRG